MLIAYSLKPIALFRGSFFFAGDFAALDFFQDAFAQGIRSVAIVLMHGYRYPSHEQRLAEIAREDTLRIFQGIVLQGLLPVFTAILGYLFAKGGNGEGGD